MMNSGKVEGIDCGLILKPKHMYGRTDRTSWDLGTFMLMTKILFRLSWKWSRSAINIV